MLIQKSWNFLQAFLLSIIFLSCSWVYQTAPTFWSVTQSLPGGNQTAIHQIVLEYMWCNQLGKSTFFDCLTHLFKLAASERVYVSTQSTGGRYVLPSVNIHVRNRGPRKHRDQAIQIPMHERDFPIQREDLAYWHFPLSCKSFLLFAAENP